LQLKLNCAGCHREEVQLVETKKCGSDLGEWVWSGKTVGSHKMGDSGEESYLSVMEWQDLNRTSHLSVLERKKSWCVHLLVHTKLCPPIPWTCHLRNSITTNFQR
jgi:hypothetical protein